MRWRWAEYLMRVVANAQEQMRFGRPPDFWQAHRIAGGGPVEWERLRRALLLPDRRG